MPRVDIAMAVNSTNAIDISQYTPPALRLAQAKHCLDLFNHASKPNDDCWFDMAMYFDAFLFCFVSIEEMVPKAIKEQIQTIESFKFFKALRNITTHHSIIAGASPAAKFPKPLVRSIPMSIGTIETDPVEFKLKPDVLRLIFDEILKVRPYDRKTIDPARNFLNALEVDGQSIYIRHVMDTAIEDIELLIMPISLESAT